MEGIKDLQLPGEDTHLKGDGSGFDQKHEGIEISPTPGFVIKTKKVLVETGDKSEDCIKVFINVCYHDVVATPGKVKKLDENGKEAEGYNLPTAVGPIRSCEDKSGNTNCFVVDTVVHPSIQIDIDNDKTTAHRDFICKVLIQCVEKKYDKCSPLDERYKLPKLSYIGYIDTQNGQVVRKATENTETCKQMVRDTRRRPKIEEIKPSSSSLTNKKPKEEIQKEAIPFDIYFLLSNEEKLGVDTFINMIQDLSQNASLQELAHFPFQIDSNMHFSFPILFDPAFSPTLKVSQVEIHFSMTSKQVACTNVEMADGILYVTSPQYLDIECILPFWVNPNSTKCNYDEMNSELRIIATISDIEDCPDTGSQVWLLNNALSVADSKKTKHNIKCSPNTKENYDSDPYYLGILDCIREGEQQDLPEDQFHSKDSLSKFNIQKQDDEIKEKTKKREDERKLRMSGSDVEYIDVEDFKPGGKHFDTKPNEENQYNVTDHPTEQNINLKKAKGFLREKGGGEFQNEFWMELF